MTEAFSQAELANVKSRGRDQSGKGVNVMGKLADWIRPDKNRKCKVGEKVGDRLKLDPGWGDAGKLALKPDGVVVDMAQPDGSAKDAIGTQ